MSESETSGGCNFAGRIVARLGERSYLADAATSEIIRSFDLARFIRGFGADLLSAGLQPGDPIIIGCQLSPASSIAYLGAMYAGLVPVPIEESALAASAEVLVDHTGARALWTEKPHLFESIHNGIQIINGHPAETCADAISPMHRRENDLAALVATSGSTGAPNFVMVSHGNLIANTEAIMRSQGLADDESAMLILPLSYCFGASILHSHLYQGGGVVFDRRFMFPDKVLRAVSQYECTTFAGVPTVYNILLRRSNIRSIAMRSLRRFLQAGGALAPERVVEMRAVSPTTKFYVMYGQTEATARIACLDPESLDEKLGSVGRPLENLTVTIVDSNGRELPLGEIGEIVVRGPSVALGYLNEPDASRRVFKDEGLYTGDLGHLDKDGYLWIDGRMGAFLKMRGIRVGFAEVEARVAAVPGVYECAATSVAHEEVGEALVLYIVPDRDAHDVTDEVRRSLPVHWTCDSIRIVSEIPKTSNGKVAREVLS